MYDQGSNQGEKLDFLTDFDIKSSIKFGRKKTDNKTIPSIETVFYGLNY